MRVIDALGAQELTLQATIELTPLSGLR